MLICTLHLLFPTSCETSERLSDLSKVTQLVNGPSLTNSTAWGGTLPPPHRSPPELPRDPLQIMAKSHSAQNCGHPHLLLPPPPPPCSCLHRAQVVLTSLPDLSRSGGTGSWQPLPRPMRSSACGATTRSAGGVARTCSPSWTRAWTCHWPWRSGTTSTSTTTSAPPPATRARCAATTRRCEARRAEPHEQWAGPGGAHEQWAGPHEQWAGPHEQWAGRAGRDHLSLHLPRVP